MTSKIDIFETDMHLTLTSVVFEFDEGFTFRVYEYDLTLTSVVFE